MGHFRVGDKRYKPGEIVELPDEFPAHLYSFLQPVGAKAALDAPKPSEAQLGPAPPIPVGRPLKGKGSPRLS